MMLSPQIKICYLLLLSVLIGCAGSPNSTAPSSLSHDSLAAAHDTILPPLVEEKGSKMIDTLPTTTLSYIGVIEDFYFVDNKEVYVELYFKKDSLTYEDWKQAAKWGDSLIYGDDENERTRIPLEKAKAHFDMRGLDDLRIFDEKGEFVSHADFVRVEYLNQNVSPCFIAVFETETRLPSGPHYGIGNALKNPETSHFKVFEDSTLTQKLTEEFEISQEYLGSAFKGLHISLPQTGDTLSVINSDMYAYILHTTADSTHICFKSNEPENFGAFMVIPIYKNQLPLILTVSYLPESDMMWNKLLSFDGAHYQMKEHQRVTW